MTANADHETYIHAIAAIVRQHADEADRAKITAVKLVYGAGDPTRRGTTFYAAWQNGARRSPNR